jgi:hypothetical protein
LEVDDDISRGVIERSDKSGKPTLLDTIDAKSMTVHGFCTLTDHFDVTNARRYRFTGEMSLIYDTMRVKTNTYHTG